MSDRKLYGGRAARGVFGYEVVELAATDECVGCGGEPHRSEVIALRCLAKYISSVAKGWRQAAGVLRLRAFEMAKAAKRAKREVGFRARTPALDEAFEPDPNPEQGAPW